MFSDQNRLYFWSVQITIPQSLEKQSKKGVIHDEPKPGEKPEARAAAENTMMTAASREHAKLWKSFPV